MTGQEESKRFDFVMKLYAMTLEELKQFKKLAYGEISEGADRLIDKAIAIKKGA